MASCLSPQNKKWLKYCIFLYMSVLHLPFSSAPTISGTIRGKPSTPSETDSSEGQSSEPWEYLWGIKVHSENCFSWFKFNLDSSSVPILKKGHLNQRKPQIKLVGSSCLLSSDILTSAYSQKQVVPDILGKNISKSIKSEFMIEARTIFRYQHYNQLKGWLCI